LREIGQWLLTPVLLEEVCRLLLVVSFAGESRSWLMIQRQMAR
jgi:hypothetical protein